MASTAKRRSKGSKASDGKRKRKHSGSDEDGPAFLSSKYAEPPTSKIYNSRFNHTQPAELFRKDLISAMKMPDNEPLSSDDYWLIEDSWRPEWERGVQVPVFPEALPKPDARILRKRSKEAHFKLPKKLIRFTRDSFFNPEVHVMSYTNTLAERTCRYDMDDIDLQWLTSVNQDREDFGLQPLEETFVEQVIEELEVQAYVNFQEAIKSEEGLGVEYDEDAICDVCRSPDSLESNEMVFCDSCNICVHQICYGITKIPEGSWICRTCALGIRPPCVLCPNRGGAMKTIRTGQKWAHVGCAVWIPEVSFLNFIKMEPIIKISQVPASRWSAVCTLCNEKKGACITCSEKGCKATFHVTCAFNQGLQMRAHVKNSCGDDDEFMAFCQKHSRKKFSKFSDLDEDNSVLASKDSLTSEERANLRQQKIQEKEAEFYKYVNIDEVSEMFQCDKTEIETVFNFWKLKRKSNWNRQLLTPKIDTESNCTEENSPISFLKKMVHHRQDLERARNLCYMVIKREKQVKRWTDVKEKIFLKQLEILKKEGKSISGDKKQAVLSANFGDIAYDKKYSGVNGPSPNMVSVITNLVGEDIKSPINGLTKNNAHKKSDRTKPERMPNPYAKHYLNGLVKRSQRWFPVEDKQNKTKHSDGGSSRRSKSNQRSSSSNHVNHNVDTSESKEVSDSSQTSDIKVFNNSSTEAKAEGSSSCTVDSEPSETKESVSASLADEVSKDSSSCNVYDVSVQEVYDVTVSDVYNMEDVSMSSVYPFLNLEREPDSFVDNSSDPVYAMEEVKMEVNSDSENSGCNSPYALQSEPHLKFCDNINFNGRIKKKSKPRSKFNSYKNKIITSEVLDFDQGYVHGIKQEEGEDSKTEVQKIENSVKNHKSCNNESFKLHSNTCDKNSPVYKTSNKNSEVKLKIEDSSESYISTLKVSEKSIDLKNILDNSRLKISLNRNLALELKKNNLKLSQPVVVLKSEDIVNCVKSKNLASNAKANKLTKSTSKTLKKTSSFKPSANGFNCGRSSGTSKSEDKSELKFHPISSKNSPVRTQSPIPSKPTESVKFKSSPKHNSYSKSDVTSKASSKQKNLNNQAFGSATNKCPSSPTTKCQEKTKSDSLEAKESKERTVKPDSYESKDKPSERIVVPTLKGYKIPKKPKLDKLEQSSFEAKRGNSPQSPLPKITPTNTLSNYKPSPPPANNQNAYKTNQAPLNSQNSYKSNQVPQSNQNNYNNNQTSSGSMNSSYKSTNHTSNGQCSWRKLEPRSSENPKPSAWTEDPGTWTEDPGSWVENHGSWTEGPGAWTENSGAWAEDPGTWAVDPGSWSVEPGTWSNLNGDTCPMQEERIVVKLKKNVPDPKSQRWLEDSVPFDNNRGQGWMSDFPPGHIPPLMPPPLPPFPPPVTWGPMRSRGGFSPIRRNYRPGPYT
ncbi:hypothetical protein JTE90_002249 [Oedothorax gibbosus]|uniref:PHD finger protein rhinoceros n=1 Tax=Oedothorax gibbosus TaxID=931172 RepID=A0AAV6V7R7_9ARAC|nr:hypothetical protein JTE90_002249 [Oedothorax gibbosus]